MPSNKSYVSKSEENRASQHGMKKRGMNRQQESSQNGIHHDHSASIKKSDSGSYSKSDKKLTGKSSVVGVSKPEVKTVLPIHRPTVIAYSQAASSPTPQRRPSINAKAASPPRMDSYASVAKGSTSTTPEPAPPRPTIVNERPRRRMEHEPDDKDLVRIMMRMHRMRFRDFKRNEDLNNNSRVISQQSSLKEQQNESQKEQKTETPHVNVKDQRNDVAVNAQYRSALSQPPKRSFNSSTESNLSTKSQESGKAGVGVSNGRDKAGSETVSDEQPTTTTTRQRRAEASRNHFASSRRKATGDRQANEEDERNYNYGKYRNRVHPPNVTKREFKKEERVAQA
ncbi:uncharacterized protein BBOV_IV011020 [Babesia bovis T2Bo]|nr:uncharacterized protein BBOV_IV011020 [Babesia bovis T2Bo]EDO07455.1 hypothetical protein BBOV_IV011020 [Babesia bovis T2Bo]|eukprot:XP_001611023.1 hypothetical protein [Babesia bovis T2Bo]